VRLFEVDEDDYNLVTQHDFGDKDFVYYTSPVCHYDIRESYARIASFDQLEYYAEVFLFLNPDIEEDILSGLFQWLGHRENGKSVRTYGKKRISQMTSRVYNERSTPWCRRMRRVVFNPKSIMSTEEKMSIASSIVGKSITYTEFDLIQTLDAMFRSRIIATLSSISENMSCSQRTVSRLLNDRIKEVMNTNNKNIRRQNKIEDCIEWIDILSSEGDTVKMRTLKELSNVRDYSIIKEAILLYEKHY